VHLAFHQGKSIISFRRILTHGAVRPNSVVVAPQSLELLKGTFGNPEQVHVQTSSRSLPLKLSIIPFSINLPGLRSRSGLHSDRPRHPSGVTGTPLRRPCRCVQIRPGQKHAHEPALEVRAELPYLIPRRSLSGATSKARAILTMFSRLTFRSPRSMPPT
jgi:hypothetical protein